MRTMVFLAVHILRLEIIHPCSAPLAVTRMEVCVIDGEEFTFLVKYFVCCYFGMIDLNILVLFEFQAIQFLSQAEYTFLDVLELEIRAKVIIGNGIFLLFEFLRVITEVPRLYMSSIETMSMCIILQFFHFLACSRHIGIAELVQQTEYLLRSLCHGLVERFLCIGLLVEQVRERQTGIHYLHNNTGVVEFSAHTFAYIRHIELAADIAVIQVLHYRNGGCRFEVQQIAFQAFLLCVGAKHRLGVIVKTGEKSLVRNEHSPGVGCLENILAVLERQFAQFGCQFAVGLLVFRREVSTVIGKRLIDIFQQFILSFVQFQFAALVIDGFDTLEQSFVQTDG